MTSGIMNRRTMVWLIPLCAFILGMPLFIGGYATYVMDMVGIYALAALGLNILSGYCGQISLGHAGFFAIGAFASAALGNIAGIPFWLAMPLSGIIASLIALMIGAPILRLKFIFLAITTIGFAIVTNNMLYSWKDISGGASGMAVPKATLGPLVLGTDQTFYYVIVIVVATLTLLFWNLSRSKTGRAFLAIRESETAAAVAGINVARYKVTAFVISAFYTGIAGSLLAYLVRYINIEVFDFLMSLTFIAMCIIGGVASIAGSFLGAAFIVLLPELLRGVPGAKDLQLLVYGLAMIIVIVVRPRGLASIRVRGNVIKGLKDLLFRKMEGRK
jgi:branched-chain amino acid transport system permease protein